MNYHLQKSISIPDPSFHPSYKSYRAKLTIIYAGPRGIFIFYKFETRYVSSRKYLFSIRTFSFAQFLECNLLCTIIKLRKKLKKRRKRKKRKEKRINTPFFLFFWNFVTFQ